MSVDFYECEVCGECRHEDYVLTVPTNVDGGDLQICKWCLEDMVENGEIITYDEYDLEEGEVPNLTHDMEEAIKDYSIYGVYTEKGLQIKLDNVKKSIENQLKVINEIETMLDSRA